jgi:hypothetical protein
VNEVSLEEAQCIPLNVLSEKKENSILQEMDFFAKGSSTVLQSKSVPKK